MEMLCLLTFAGPGCTASWDVWTRGASRLCGQKVSECGPCVVGAPRRRQQEPTIAEPWSRGLQRAQLTQLVVQAAPQEGRLAAAWPVEAPPLRPSGGEPPRLDVPRPLRMKRTIPKVKKMMVEHLKYEAVEQTEAQPEQKEVLELGIAGVVQRRAASRGALARWCPRTWSWLAICRPARTSE